MKNPIQLTTTTSSVKSSLRRSSRDCGKRAFLLIPLVLATLALAPAAKAVLPAPDGGYANQNTAEGEDALFSLSSGSFNTANGYHALYGNTSGSFNTASGYSALSNNTTGGDNTAAGYNALALETTGGANTAIGFQALALDTTGGNNTATGLQALFSNTTGNSNTADGVLALFSNTTGFENTATGFEALYRNTLGGDNTANGFTALFSNTTGSNNTADGLNALLNNTSGNSNIALGSSAGSNLTTGSNNIEIGNLGVAAEANTIRIGKKLTQTATFIAGISGTTVAGGVGVFIDTNGRLGTIVSSERFKDAIRPMDKASEAILALKPVTFRYKHELDPKGILQFGLVAEEVEKVNPALVARDDEGKPYTVRYEAVNAMLLNEFLKEHRKVEEQGRRSQEQEATIAELKSTAAKQAAIIAQQQEEIGTLIASVKEQASQIRKVSDQLEPSKPASRMLVNGR